MAIGGAARTPDHQALIGPESGGDPHILDPFKTIGELNLIPIPFERWGQSSFSVPLHLEERHHIRSAACECNIQPGPSIFGVKQIYGLSEYTSTLPFLAIPNDVEPPSGPACGDI